MRESVDAYVIGRGLARLRRSTALLLVTAAYLVATAVGVGIGIAASVAGWAAEESSRASSLQARRHALVEVLA